MGEQYPSNEPVPQNDKHVTMEWKRSRTNVHWHMTDNEGNDSDTDEGKDPQLDLKDSIIEPNDLDDDLLLQMEWDVEDAFKMMDDDPMA